MVSRTAKVRSGMLAAGLSSDVSERALSAGYTLSKLRRATTAELAKHFSDEQIRFIKKRLQRRKIHADVVFRLLNESNSQCCLCWDFKSDAPIIFHHIDEHSKTANDSYENLVVLCLNHHGRAHTRSGLDRTAFPPDIIRERKREWIYAVESHRKGDRVAPGSENQQTLQPAPQAPALATRLLGRDLYCDTVDALISAGSKRIAIRGMGGIGKTSLVLHLAHSLSRSFPGGVLWASLGDYSGDADALLKQWARLTGAIVPDGVNTNEFADALRAWLAASLTRSGRQLIILDDARIEWLTETKSIVRAVPADAVLLITTRDLAVATASNCQVVELEVLEHEHAVELLNLHSGHDLRLTDEEAAHQLVRLVGNLPLALELLGKHVGAKRRKPGFELPALVAELQKERLNRLDLPGHPALSSVFSLSYNSLAEREKRSFRSLGLFSGTLILGAHLAGVLEAPHEQVEQSLDSFVDASLLNWAEQAGTYRIHPLLREYSIALLTRKKAEVERMRSAHLRYFADLSVRSARTPSEGVLEQSLPELVHAIKVAGRSHPQIVLDVAKELWIETGVLGTQGFYRESVILLDAAASAAKRVGQFGLAAAHIGNLATVHSILGDNTKAKECYQRALTMVGKLEDQYDRPAFLGNLGMLLQQEGDYAGAYRLFQESLENALDVGNFETAINQFGNLGSFLRHRDPASARAYYERGARLANRSGSVRTRANFLSNLGLLDFDAGNLDQAEDLIKEALEVARRIRDRKAVANRLGHLGNIAVVRGKHEVAVDYFEEAVKINHEIGYVAREADWLSNLGMALWRTGEHAKGISMVRNALELSSTSQHVEAIGLNHLRLTALLYKTGEVDEANAHFAAAQELLGTLQFPITLTDLP